MDDLFPLLDSSHDQKVLFRLGPATDFPTQFASPTFNQNSRRKWAADHVGRLEHFHQDIQPTHLLTVGYNAVIDDLKNISDYHHMRRDAVAYFNRKKGYVGGIWVLEIEKNNVCHEHLLVRTDLDDPMTFFANNAAKVNRKLGTAISVDYCHKLGSADDVERTTKYVFKLVRDEKKKPLLFKSRLGLRFTGQFGNYFGGAKQSELRRQVASSLDLNRMVRLVADLIQPPYQQLGENCRRHDENGDDENK